MDVLSRIGMLSIQTADDRIFLPEMFFDDMLVVVITVFCKVQHMRPSAACHDISVMVQEVHVEVLVCSLILTVTSNCLWVFLLNANVPSDGKSKGTLVVNTGKIIGASIIVSVSLLL